MEYQEKNPNTLFVSYSNGYEGYVPPAEEIHNGTYAGLWSSFFTGRNPLLPEAEDMLKNEVSSIIEETKNK